MRRRLAELIAHAQPLFQRVDLPDPEEPGLTSAERYARRCAGALIPLVLQTLDFTRPLGHGVAVRVGPDWELDREGNPVPALAILTARHVIQHERGTFMWSTGRDGHPPARVAVPFPGWPFLFPCELRWCGEGAVDLALLAVLYPPAGLERYALPLAAALDLGQRRRFFGIAGGRCHTGLPLDDYEVRERDDSGNEQ